MARQIAKYLVFVSGVLLSGCALQQEAIIPKLEEPTAFRGGTVIVREGEDFSTYAWWERLNDPQLNELINLALANNHDLQIAVANVEQAEAQLRATRYAWIPTLDAQAGGVGSGGIDTSYANKGSANFSNGLGRVSAAYGAFVPSYSLNIFALINQTRVAEASLEIQKAARNAAQLSVVGQVAGSYFNLIVARRALVLQEEEIKLLVRLKNVNEARFNAGGSDAENLHETAGRLQTARSAQASVRDDIQRTENALQLLTGKMPGTIVTSKIPADITIGDLIPSKLPSSVLHQRPDLLMAENNLMASDAQVSVANAAFFPTISLTGLLGGASAMLSNLFSVQGGFWGATGSVAAPVLNARKLAEVSAAEAKQKAAYANYLQAVKYAFGDVDSQLTSLQIVKQKQTDLIAAHDAAKRLAVIRFAKFKAGAADIRLALEAEIAAVESEGSVNEGSSRQLSQLVTVFQSLAAGYAVTAGERAVEQSAGVQGNAVLSQ